MKSLSCKTRLIFHKRDFRRIVYCFTIFSLFVIPFSFIYAQEAEYLIQNDFQTCNYSDWLTITSQSAQGGIEGNFPVNWSDNSHWSSIVYTSTQTTENSESFWRIDAPVAETGRIQLKHSLPSLMGGNQYRYEFSIEAKGNQSIYLGIRQKTFPYKFLWQVNPILTSEWETFTWEFVMRETLQDEVSFIMYALETPGQIDFKNISLKQIDQSLIKTNFATCDYGQFVTIQSKSEEGVIQGNFPSGWSDNSAWASVVYESLHKEDEAELFWNINAQSIGLGQLQVCHGLPEIMGGENNQYTLRVKARGDSNFEFVVRQKASPYYAYWSTGTNMVSPEWQTFEWEFTLPETEPGEVGFWMIVQHSPASIDLKEIELVEVRSDLVEAYERSIYTGSGPANLLRQSRLPAGLPSGWSLYRDFDDLNDVTITSVADATSPSGCDVLKINSPDTEMQLYGEPVCIHRKWLNHMASFYVKGNGELVVSVYNERSRLGGTTVTLDNQTSWSRHIVNFQPEESYNYTYLRFDGQGTFYLDGLMMHSGSTVQLYQSQNAVEVAFSPGPGEIADYARCHFDDENAVVKYIVTGVPDGESAVLKLKIVNVYGDELDLQPVLLTGSAQYEGSINYNVFNDKPYGSFRVEGYVENSQGDIISTYNELVMHRFRRPKYWLTDAPNSPFGIHTVSTRRHIQMAKASGINWTRLHDAGTEYIGWYHLEEDQGQWNFRDVELQRYRQYGMKILGALSTAPKWASMYPGFDVSTYFDRYYMPVDYNQFANDYVKVVVARYANIIDAWDLWNEPWGERWSCGYNTVNQHYIAPANEAQTFAEFQQVVYQAVKSVDQDGMLLGFNSVGNETGVNWTSGMIAAGAIPYADKYSYHLYVSASIGYPGDSIKQKHQMQVDLFPGQQLPYKAWVTEGSPTYSTISSGFYNHTLPQESSEDILQTSNLLGRYCLSMLTSGVEKFFLYSMGTHRYFDMTNGHHVLLTEEGYLHPSAGAMSTLAYFLEDASYQSYELLSDCVHAYHFTCGNNSVTVFVTSPGERETYLLPDAVNVQYYDLFGNPVTAGTEFGDTLVFALSPISD